MTKHPDAFNFDYKCELCDYKKKDTDVGMICPICGGSIKSKSFAVSNITAYKDNQLGVTITSNYQREKLMKKQGLHYAEDNPKNRAIRKQADYYLGKKGEKAMDKKANKEFQRETQKYARKDFKGRVEKGLEKVTVPREVR